MSEPTRIQIVLQALDQARAQIAGVGKEIQALGTSGSDANKHFSETPSALRSIKEQLLEIGAAAAGAFAIEHIVEFVHAAIEGAEALQNFADQLGGSVEDLSRRMFAALQVGLRQEQFEQALRTLGLKVTEAIEDPASKAAAAFKAVGVAYKDAFGNERGRLAIFDDLAQAFSKYENGSRKAGLAAEFFGSRQTRIITLLNQGKSGLQKSAAEADQLGITTTKDQAEKAREFNEELKKLKATAQGVALDFGVALLPALTGVGKALTDVAKSATGFHEIFGAIATIVGVMSLAVVGAIDKFALFGSVIGKTAAAELEVAKGNFSGAFAIIKDIGADIGAEADRALKRAEQLNGLLTGKKPAELPGEKAAEGEEAGTSQDPVPNLTKREDLIKRQISDIEAKRSAAESEYQLQLLKTQKLVNDGSITETDAFKRNQEAASALRDRIGELNGKASESAVIWQSEIWTERAKIEQEYSDALQKTTAELEAQRITEAQKNATDLVALEQRNKQLVTLNEQTRLLNAQNNQLINTHTAADIAATKPRFAGPQNLSQGLDDFTTGLGNSSSRIQGVFQGINAEISTTAQGITGLITGTQTWGQAFQHVRLSIINTLVEITLQSLVQAAIRSAIRTAETTHHAAQVGAQVATHTAGEATKTGATVFGSVGRGLARLGETIFHGIQVGIRVAAHLVGEAAMTVATIANTALRIPAMLAEAVPALITAAMKAAGAVADIPYVGPILAVAAMAAVIAAGAKYVGGFEHGGYTGPGEASRPAGVVHAGEFVFTKTATDRIGVNNLYSMMHAAQAGRAQGIRVPSAGALPGYGGGGLVASVGGASVNVHMGLLNTRQDQRDFQAREGIKMTLDYMRQRSNRRSA